MNLITIIRAQLSYKVWMWLWGVILSEREPKKICTSKEYSSRKKQRQDLDKEEREYKDETVILFLLTFHIGHILLVKFNFKGRISVFIYTIFLFRKERRLSNFWPKLKNESFIYLIKSYFQYGHKIETSPKVINHRNAVKNIRRRGIQKKNNEDQKAKDKEKVCL